MSPEQHGPELADESLPQKLLGIHQALADHDIPHAFGGAIALAYHAEPRATDDIDLNILLPPAQGPGVLSAFEGLFAIADRASQLQAIAEQDQTRLLWNKTYVDLFFANTDFHASLAERVQEVDFGGTMVPIISAEDLVVCKALFDRSHDWQDIERICRIQGTRLDRGYVEHWLAYFLGDDQRTTRRFQELAAGTDTQHH